MKLLDSDHFKTEYFAYSPIASKSVSRTRATGLFYTRANIIVYT